MAEGVAPSKLGTQPIGEVARVAGGVHQLKLPVPFPLRFVSVYLVGGDDGWTLVDTGYDYPPTYEAWERGAAAVGCDLSNDVGRIVVTHFHPDHLGGARWLQERSGAPVYMLEDEIPFSRRLWGDPGGRKTFAEYLIRHGMPRKMAEPAAADIRSGLPLSDEMLPIRPGERLLLGSNAAHIIHTLGMPTTSSFSTTRRGASSLLQITFCWRSRRTWDSGPSRSRTLSPATSGP